MNNCTFAFFCIEIIAKVAIAGILPRRFFQKRLPCSERAGLGETMTRTGQHPLACTP
ncbi:hypothetical protein [Scytonema sp. HK-05]|uniref:hypothetical protein n=1 Tax=Scytonema sp. HK-05 TaxID=1137095 RepID=UPI00403F3907